MPLFSQQRDAVAPTQRQPQAAPPAGAGATALLKRYRPLETRAAGGFGSVEVCLDARLQRRVAIKRMPLSSAQNPGASETTATALAEARTASMLQHPNIVQVIDFTYDEAYAYLVMEYVDGMSLEEFLAGVDGHSLTFDEAAAVADALAQALAFAHENGVLHLDIKPANVLIDRAGHVKLTDFGMAALASSAGFGGARGGTIGYMPPEQLRGEPVDERTDIFALAAVLYECLCANAPYRAATAAASLKGIERGVTPPGELLPDLPEGAEAALLEALSPAPSDRMASVQDFGERFLKRLGNPREGRKSLARIIARLASDENDTAASQVPADGAPARPTWRLDPAEGWLGSRFPRARRVLVGAVCGLATARVLWWVLGALEVSSAGARAVVAVATGAAAAAAPQLGSALALAGFLALAVDGGELFAVLPVAVVAFALAAAWWLTWGRAGAASAVFCALFATGCSAGGAPGICALAGALAGYFLAPGTAAAATLFGLGGAALLRAAGQGGGLPLSTALSALADAELWLRAAALAGGSALVSRALSHTWERYRAGAGTGFLGVALAVPPALSLALLALEDAVEIASPSTVEIAGALGWGILASIITCMCVYMLGYRKTLGDGD